ncbi:hypothetical protein FRACYDRAFT_244510 [Fragilariopsis cylindrus CCMP1102]|uniref:Uncharacterized protein n=1 Tax=Fragilariopsis cylindrus CCMP1102 TaxID=635003 RepID=A0A1E7F290_9STRA|nr:hypothetical protein FRACYDRAFT_244510 [Fragilariopsis cylindrus CCMP1102]|eukprot:OEU12249.1 hypothetical protein FRACYDRAFT_244510 [Fragilariopsis cylindrus CCMP1102]
MGVRSPSRLIAPEIHIALSSKRRVIRDDSDDEFVETKAFKRRVIRDDSDDEFVKTKASKRCDDGKVDDHVEEDNEDIPNKSPDHCYGDPVKLTVYADADHAGNNVTRQSVTGILLPISNTPLVWISKRQRTVETSTFGSEMIAPQMAIDLIIGMRYKLQCLGIKVGKRSELLDDRPEDIATDILDVLTPYQHYTQPTPKTRSPHSDETTNKNLEPSYILLQQETEIFDREHCYNTGLKYTILELHILRIIQ